MNIDINSKLGEKKMLNDRFSSVDTGEIYEGIDIYNECIELFLNEQYRKQENKIKGIRIAKSKDSFHRYLDDNFGKYFFHNYNSTMDKFYVNEKFESAMLFRFIYLCTYMDFDNCLRFGSKFRNKHRAFMTERDLGEVLGLSARETINTKAFLYQIGVLKYDGDKLKIDLCTTTRGELPKSYKQKSTRVFHDSIRELYENSKPMEHKRLGLLFRILPLINYKHNIVCENTSEDCITNVVSYDMKKLCKLVGYSEKNHLRLKNDLFGIKIKGRNVIGIFEKQNKSMIVINPAIYYAGNRLDEVQAINNLFCA